MQKSKIMETTSLKIDILNPKAFDLLQNLADLELISIKKTKKINDFQQIVKKIRVKSEKNPISLEEITNEVEEVRRKRYEK